MSKLNKFNTMTLIELGEQWEKYNYLMDKEHHLIKLNLDRLTRAGREETKLRIQKNLIVTL